VTDEDRQTKFISKFSNGSQTVKDRNVVKMGD